MGKLSAAQIAGVVQYAVEDKAGRNVYRLQNPDTDGPIFVAIALAESGGDPTVTHKNSNGSTDYGLWQINSVHTSLLAGGDWKDPSANFMMANSLYEGRGYKFTDWTTYKDGKYAVFMPQATAAWGARGQFRRNTLRSERCNGCGGRCNNGTNQFYQVSDQPTDVDSGGNGTCRRCYHSSHDRANGAQTIYPCR